MNYSKSNWISIITAICCISCASSKESKIALNGEIEIARQALSKNDYQGVISQLQALRRKYTQDSSIELMLGTAYLGLGNILAANKSFLHAVEINHENQDAMISLSYTQIMLKQTKQARETLNDLRKNKSYPYMEKVYINYGLSYLEEKNCTSAIPEFEAALDIDPTSAVANFNIGKCFFFSKKFEQAINYYKKSVLFCPSCLDPSMDLAKAYYFSGHKNMAITQIERLLSEKLDKSSEKKAKDLMAQLKK